MVDASVLIGLIFQPLRLQGETPLSGRVSTLILESVFCRRVMRGPLDKAVNTAFDDSSEYSESEGSWTMLHSGYWNMSLSYHRLL